MFHAASGSLASEDEDFFLGLFADQAVIDMVYSSLEETGRWEKRRRCLSATVVVWLTLMLALHRHLSIPNTFLKLSRAAEERRPDLPRSAFSVTNEALCHSRSRLGFEPLMNLFGKTAEKIQPEASFGGCRVWLIDGTVCNLPDTVANEEHFGRPKTPRGRAAFPQLKLVLLTCATTRRVKAIRILPCTESECTALYPLLSHLSEGDLVFVDRGLASYQLMHECKQRGIHLVMRINSGYKPKIKDQLETGDYLVEAKFTVPAPERTGRRKTRDILVTSRMILFRFHGEKKPVRLLTTLSLQQASAQSLAEGYHIRWEVELGIGELKTHLATVCHGSLHTPFRSKSPLLVLQEIFALFATYNLIRSTMVEAAVVHNLDPLHISFVGTLEVLRTALPYLLLLNSSDEWSKARCRLLSSIVAQKLVRPRRPRKYPRKVKQKMSNFKVKGAKDLGYLCDFKAGILLGDAA